MRVLIQRVTRASVEVEGSIVGEIGSGMLVLLGIEQSDSAADVDYLVNKVIHLRIFDDKQGKMNLSLRETGGSLLVVSQFTLYGDCRKGRRPSFTQAMAPGPAEALYERFVALCKAMGARVETGRLRAMMDVELVNEGPVTLLLDSKRTF